MVNGFFLFFFHFQPSWFVGFNFCFRDPLGYWACYLFIIFRELSFPCDIDVYFLFYYGPLYLAIDLGLFLSCDSSQQWVLKKRPLYICFFVILFSPGYCVLRS